VAGGTQAVPANTRSFVSAIYMGGTTCVAGFGPIFASLIASNFDEQAPVVALQALSSLLIVSLVLIYFLPEPATLPKEEPQQGSVAQSGDLL
jgi:hypothetical protein